MKRVIGIISIVLFIIVGFQSCAAGFGNTVISSNDVSGSAGVYLSITMIIAGTFALMSKYSKGLTITAIILYMLGGIVGLTNLGSFKSLLIWSILNLIFAGFLIYDIVKNKKLYEKKP